LTNLFIYSTGIALIITDFITKGNYKDLVRRAKAMGKMEGMVPGTSETRAQQ